MYLRGWIEIRKTRATQFSGAQLCFFLSGRAVLWLAIGSPMDGFADALLSAHMIEHLLIMSVVPPLLLLGTPVVPLLRGLPAGVLKRVLAPVIRLKTVQQCRRWIVAPVVA